MPDSSDTKYRELLDHFFRGSAQFPLSESIDGLLDHVCKLLVESGLYAGAVLLVADVKFRIRHVGLHSATEAMLPILRERIGQLDGQALRPFDFLHRGETLGDAQRISAAASAGDTAGEASQLTIPMLTPDGGVVGFLSVLAESRTAGTGAADVSLLETLLLHASLQIQHLRTRGQSRLQIAELGQRLQERTAEVRSAQEKFSRLVTVSRDVVVTTDEHELINYINQAFVDALGYVRENYLGRPVSALLRELAADRTAADELLRTIEGGDDDLAVVPCEFRTATGERRHFDLTRARIRLADAVRGTQFMLRDVTEQRALFGHLIASERLAATGRLAAGIAHEINNPLQAMLSQLNALQTKIDLQQGGEHVERIREAIERIRQVLRGMADLNRGGGAERGDVQLNDVVESTLALLKPRLGESAITVHKLLQPELPTLHGVIAEMQQLLLNLLLNAMESMPNGGELRVETEVREGLIDLRIKDGGEGIAAEHLPRIFDPFFTRKPSGTGLGLYISKGIAERHQATIAVDSAPGHGSTFTVRFRRR